MRLDIRNKTDVRLFRQSIPYLNGVKVPKCVMADEEAGVIERWLTGEDGHVLAFEDEHGEMCPRLIREHGTVRIELLEHA